MCLRSCRFTLPCNRIERQYLQAGSPLKFWATEILEPNAVQVSYTISISWQFLLLNSGRQGIQENCWSTSYSRWSQPGSADM